MRQWYPDGGASIELEDVYAELDPEGPWVAIGMVSSLDGMVTIDGVSGPLGGAGDLAALRGLRAAVDVIVVGAGTARAEGYGHPTLTPGLCGRRRARGLSERPAIAVVTASGDLTGAERLLDPGRETRTIVVCCATTPEPVRAELAEQAEVVVAGEDEVDPARALQALGERGLTRVVLEGGPGLNGQMLRAGLVDEVFVTVTGWLVGGDGPGLIGGAAPDAPVPLVLLEGRVHDGEVLLRCRVGAPE